MMDGAGKQQQSQPAVSGPDQSPELCRYPDEGCKLARSCLTCPFPDCLHGEQRGKQHCAIAARDREIRRLKRRGRSIQSLAKLFKVDQRTVRRALKRSPGANRL